jgi:lysophospholipase L1-like esterase
MRAKVLALVALVTVGTLALPTAAQAHSQPSSPTYYVSVGDSYSVGYQPGVGSTPGYTAYVASRTHFKLVNFGCSGATTSSILDSVGCPAVLPGTIGGVTYPTTTQITAAEAFLTAHRGHIGLITVTIGGNDVIGCALKADLFGCVDGAAKNITTNVTMLASDLRTAAGAKVPIIGLTYPDVLLGAYVWPKQPPIPLQLTVAKESVTAFRLLVNPALAKAYASSSAAFVDVTAATGAYTSLSRTVKAKTYGTIPVAVASVCTLTWFCALGNIHARTPGYTLIGQLVVAKYGAMTKR